MGVADIVQRVFTRRKDRIAFTSPGTRGRIVRYCHLFCQLLEDFLDVDARANSSADLSLLGVSPYSTGTTHRGIILFPLS